MTSTWMGDNLKKLLGIDIEHLLWSTDFIHTGGNALGNILPT